MGHALDMSLEGCEVVKRVYTAGGVSVWRVGGVKNHILMDYNSTTI